ncbi:MAG: hypothetical protein OXB98_22975 [Bryobacterales bacterium]|nr:hypothetical protein [Bryobacterales bacterium]
MLVGYARASSQDQDLTLQREEFVAAGCTHVYAEKISAGGPSSDLSSSVCWTAFGPKRRITSQQIETARGLLDNGYTAD